MYRDFYFFFSITSFFLTWAKYFILVTVIVTSGLLAKVNLNVPGLDGKDLKLYLRLLKYDLCL